MMDCTDKHYRYFARILTQSALLYTEMVTTGALIHGPREKLLAFDPFEKPLALQLGGENPTDLALCAKMAEDAGYDEVNLNVGCPSNRVSSGSFGLSLMKRPDRVAECVLAMKHAVGIDVTVKTRIGVDQFDSYEFLDHFTQLQQQAGCDYLWVHARLGYLKGLNPKQNREVPPLDYSRVYTLKQAYPNLGIGINGGIKEHENIAKHLKQVDGVMIGRKAYSDLYWLSIIDQHTNPKYCQISREQAIATYLPYLHRQLPKLRKPSEITRHLSSLYLGQPGAKEWRIALNQLHL